MQKKPVVNMETECKLFKMKHKKKQRKTDLWNNIKSTNMYVKEITGEETNVRKKNLFD
jgi:DNA-binding Xre family transcriptional regulator